VKHIGARLLRLLLDALQPNYDQQQVNTTKVYIYSRMIKATLHRATLE